MTDQELEARLRAFYRTEVGDDETASLSLRRDIATIPRAMPRPAGWFRRGRGLTLLAAAALLLVGGAVAAGSGLVRLPSLVPPEPAPSLAVVPTPSSTAESSSPSPSATAVAQPKPAVFVFNKGGGSSADCGNDGRGGCIPRLWVANVDGTGAHELLPGQSGCQRVQGWSPDGTRLLFSRSDCRMTTEGMFGAERFYLTDANGSEPQLVDTGCTSPCVSEDDAVFSSDGRQILFVRTRSVPVSPSATPTVTGKPAEGHEILVLASIDLTTGDVTELGDFDTCVGQCGDEYSKSYPRWSPDRTQIVYTWLAPVQPGPHPPKDPAVFVADADGRNAHRVSILGQSPTWSPDGARILFQGIRYSWTGSWYPGKVVRSSSAIYTVRADGTDLRQLTTDGSSYGPAWSADGRIWFMRSAAIASGGTVKYWVMDADGGNAAQLSGPPLFQAWQLQPTP